MRFHLTMIFIFIISLPAKAKFVVPVDDELLGAINITNTSAFCSNDAEYHNINATSSTIYGSPRDWPSTGKDVWFKFTASKYDVNISATGQINATSTNTLIKPLVALYTFEPGFTGISEMVGTSSTSNNVTSLYKGALNIGQVYYIRISAEQNNEGRFKICVDNYSSPVKPGQDCSTVSILCSKESFTQLNVTGSGSNNHESAGTCLGTESNSAWYMFRASKGGDFTFVITPTVLTDDIDWVFYDLGIDGNCSDISAATAIRCAAGSGVICTPSYYKTGLSMTENDLNEVSDCPAIPQNGFVKYVDLIEGHTYALLVDNYSNGNNGFTIEFGGIADFALPHAEITSSDVNLCRGEDLQLFTPFSNLVSYYWSGPNDYHSSDQNPLITNVGPENAGIYKLVVKAGDCESTKDSVEIFVENIPVAEFLTEPLFNSKFSAPLTVSFTNISKYADHYEWDFGDGNSSLEYSPTHNYTTEGTFKISLTSYNNGCKNSTIRGDLIITKNGATFIPNAFSPNNDGINDEFVVGITNLKKYQLQIYNRNGNQIFITDNIFDNWKGTFKSNELPVGVYYYVILATTLSNESVKYSGPITLIR